MWHAEATRKVSGRKRPHAVTKSNDIGMPFNVTYGGPEKEEFQDEIPIHAARPSG
jgi:hypothetical protein